MPAPAAIRNAPKLELLRARTPSVSPRTVRHWEQGKYRIPDGVREEIEHLEAATAQAVTAGVDTYRDLPDPSVVPLITYRSDADYRAHHPEIRWPASWHRAVCARIAHEIPGLTIVYWPDGVR